MAEKIVTEEYDRYDMDYVVGDDYKYLKCYKPHDGFELFRVGASYASQLKPSNYYVIAKNERQAKQIFSKRHGDILSFISYVKIVPKDESDKYLSEPLKYKRIII